MIFIKTYTWHEVLHNLDLFFLFMLYLGSIRKQEKTNRRQRVVWTFQWNGQRFTADFIQNFSFKKLYQWMIRRVSTVKPFLEPEKRRAITSRCRNSLSSCFNKIVDFFVNVVLWIWIKWLQLILHKIC